MEKGYIKLSRKFFENKIWQAARAFNEGEAWLDLIQLARFETSEITSRIGVHEITWGRGQYPASNRFLMRKWGRSEQWVKTFLSKLKKEKMITVDSSQGVNVITLLNYDAYNSTGNTKNSANNSQNNSPNTLIDTELQAFIAQQVAQQVTQWSLTSNSNNKKEKKDKKEINIPPVIPQRDTRDVFERFKDEMLSDDFWIEKQAMTSGIGDKFVKVIADELAKFFSWIVSTGNEETIKTLNDAKRRFFYWWRDHGKQEFEKNHVSTGVGTSPIALGLGVWIEGGKKFYGSRDNPREIPLNAPYRPSQDAKWDATNERWTVSGG